MPSVLIAALIAAGPMPDCLPDCMPDIAIVYVDLGNNLIYGRENMIDLDSLEPPPLPQTAEQPAAKPKQALVKPPASCPGGNCAAPSPQYQRGFLFRRWR